MILVLWVRGICELSDDALLSVDVGQRRSIAHLWAFMLLGQIIAISFASNLFFIAVLVGKLESRHVPAKLLPSWSWHLAVFGTLTCVAAIPWARDWDSFLWILLTPHILLFLPILSRPPPAVQALVLQVLAISTGLFLAGVVVIDIQRVSDSHYGEYSLLTLLLPEWRRYTINMALIVGASCRQQRRSRCYILLDKLHLLVEGVTTADRTRVHGAWLPQPRL